jgi:hypothetical protein
MSAEEERRRRIQRLRALHERPREEPQQPPGLTPSSVVRLIAGVWLLMSPLILGYDRGTWSVVGCGALIALLAYARPHSRRAAGALLGAQALIGVWLLASAAWLHDADAGELNTGLTGAVVIAAALASFDRARARRLSSAAG